MYYAIYNTEQEAKDDERKAFHAALHIVAGIHGWTHLLNSATQSSMLLSDITLDFITDNPLSIGFLSRTMGYLRYDVKPMFYAAVPILCTEGAYNGKYALAITKSFIQGGFDSVLTYSEQVSDPSVLFLEAE